MTKIEKSFINFEELVTYTGLPAGTIRWFILQRRIPTYRPGKRLMFRLDEINEWLQNARAGTVAERFADVRLKDMDK